MSQTSAGYPLDNNDPADQPRCPMEALADRFEGRPKPKWLRSEATRWIDGEVFFELRGWVKSPDQLDDLIAFLQEVRG